MSSRNTVWLIPLIALVTFPLWKIPVAGFLTPKGEIQSQKEQSATVPQQSFAMNDLVIYQYKGDKQDAVVRSDRGFSGDNPDLLFFDKVDADVFDAKGDLIKITSKNAEFNQKTQVLVLTKDVVSQKPSTKQTLLTQKMTYNSVTEVAYAPGKTTIITPDADIKGGNFTYDMKSGTYTMEKRVNTILQSGGAQL